MTRSSTRLPIHRTRVIRAADLSPAERMDLTRRAVAIVSQTFDHVDPQLFAKRALFRAPDVRIALFYGRSGELAGFSPASVVRIESGGVEHSVFDAGVYFDLQYDGGREATRFGLCEALRVRVAKPWIRLWFISETTSPAPYCLAARTVKEIYPHPAQDTPAEVTALVRAFAAMRGLRPVGDDPYVVHNNYGALITDPSRVQIAASLRDDPFAAHFFQRNPGFAEGHRMLLAAPLHWNNVLHGLLSPLRAARRDRGCAPCDRRHAERAWLRSDRSNHRP